MADDRSRFEAVLDAMEDAVLGLDQDGRITLLNQSARQILARPGDAKELIGRPLHAVARAPELLTMLDLLRTEEHAEVEFETSGSPPRAFLARATRQRGTPGAVLVVQDVTRLRRLEKMRKDFVANVSHELRTPVTVIRANAETLLDGAMHDPELAATFLSALLRNADRLSNLVRDLLDLSRIESGRLEFHLEALDVADTARKAVASMASEIADTETTVVITVPAEARVRADASAIEQIYVNLLGNSLKYTPAGGRIEIGARQQARFWRIEVTDDGPGIAAKHQRRVFERFYRVDKGRSRGVGGTGLGLAIVKHFATALGGKVGVQTAAPERAERPGCRFWFTVPAAESPAESPG